ncbi:uncharacterized protein LOC113852866 [Abrus precatorius]|uniref:Uncharacterized protein LOC113852866 n=1 Tax=Abrus precatorius TaxID=3816 RepID=A0A8B8K721_ABRPR|nr:uncharacterized protein LOC113852866 [Abrus precatorius]XP_027339055.1 uncharacterized protein LOC113852866 [Abrus precatorius]
MAETSTCSMISRTKSDVTAMKETLFAQQQLLQNLYTELDQEREASATAASEALEMILRLQGEKTAVKMEAIHYQRMAEEKIGHAEASLEAFEEIINQKEMEITSLEFQVQAYKHKLVNLGCDLNASEFEFLNRGDIGNGENVGQSSTVRRLHSMPPIQLKSPLKASARKRERSPSPMLDVIPVVVEDSIDRDVAPPSLDLSRKTVDFRCDNGTPDSYLNQIKMLNEQVKVVSDCGEGEKSANLSGRSGRSCSIVSQASTEITCDITDRLISSNSDATSQGGSTNDGEGAAGNSPCLLNVHDVFEVPETSEMHEVSEHGKRGLEKWNSDAENRLTKPDPVSEGMVESPIKDGVEKNKGMLKVHREIKTPWPKDVMMTIGQKREGMGVDCDAEAEFQKLNQRIERLERERNSARQEITHEENGEEQLKLLKDIQSQLNLIQSEIRGWKTKKATPMDDVSLSLASLQEAMLHFWL